MNADRFLAFVEVTPEGHWLWKGRKTSQGRLVYVTGSGRRVAPRMYACELSMGRGPHGHLVHKCGNKDCVRFAPGHWEESRNSLEAHTPDTRRNELMPQDVDAFKALFRKGMKARSIQHRLGLTDTAYDKLRMRATGAA